jgi:hypothetical protein
MSTCIKCGGSLGDPFDFSSTTVSSCQCNLAGLVSTSEALPSNPCCVISVADKTGEVQLTINDIDLLGNQFFTESAARAIISASAPLAYNPLTGVVSHSASGVPVGTYGSSIEVPVITINESGHITGVTLQALVYPDLGLELPAIEALSGSGFLVKTAVGTWTFRSINSTSRLTVTYPDGVTGDPVIDLAVSGVTAGTYGSSTSYPVINVDAYGRVTNASSLVIPTPTLPAHTHSLGDLSNVNDEVDTLATVDQVLYWTGNQWSYKTLPVNAVAYNYSTITPYSSNGWGECVGDGDVDTVTQDDPINTISKLTDTANLITVSINAAFYVVWSNITAIMTTLGAVRYVESYKLGTIPATYRPVHTTTITLPGIIQPTRYWDSGKATQFAGRQINIHMSCTITPAGDMYLSLVLPTESANYSTATLSSTAHLIVPIVCSYPTKVFVV